MTFRELAQAFLGKIVHEDVIEDMATNLEESYVQGLQAGHDITKPLWALDEAINKVRRTGAPI